MTHPTLQDQIAVATANEDLHVPALFGQWAERVLDAIPIERGIRLPLARN
ncbi:MAG: hypothetical protein OEY20_04500 [Gemmatimonadota bacterium]|nr:hypothetical protein [Gemmatimonadota bacterium]MDH5196489.1 hypothetical protein [Gemmatimonadota bacterium]